MCRIIVKVSGADTVDAPRYRSPSLIDTFLKSSVRASRLSSPRATLALAFLSLSSSLCLSHSSRLLSHCYTFNQRFRIYLVVTPAHLAASVSSTLTISFFHSLSLFLSFAFSRTCTRTYTHSSSLYLPFSLLFGYYSHSFSFVS